MAKQPEQMEIIKNWAFSFTCLATWNSHVDLQSRCNIGTVGTHYVLKNDNQFQLETLTVRHCLAWTPDTSSEKGVERVWGITRKCLAEMALFLNPEKLFSNLQHDWSDTIYHTTQVVLFQSHTWAGSHSVCDYPCFLTMYCIPLLHNPHSC